MSTVDESLLDPSSSPKAMSKKAGVRRVNNVPLYLAVAALTTFVAVVAMVARDRAAQQNADPEAETVKTGSSRNFAKEITAKGLGAVVPPEFLPVEMTAVSPVEAVPLAKLDTRRAEPSVPVIRLDAPPLPAPRQGGGSLGNGEERVRQDRTREQALEQALKARTSVQFTENRNRLAAAGGASLSASSPNTALAVYQQRLQQVRAAGLGVGGGASVAPPLGEAVR